MPETEKCLLGATNKTRINNLAVKTSNYAKWIAVFITLASIFAGIIWNAAVLRNDVEHLKADTAKIKEEIKQIRQLFYEKPAEGI